MTMDEKAINQRLEDFKEVMETRMESMQRENTRQFEAIQKGIDTTNSTLAGFVASIADLPKQFTLQREHEKEIWQVKEDKTKLEKEMFRLKTERDEQMKAVNAKIDKILKWVYTVTGGGLIIGFIIGILAEGHAWFGKG